jgi:long-chain acyl-CoA synthetase
VGKCAPGHSGDDDLRASLTAYCADHLSKQKWPRSIDFVDVLPRSEPGKLLRGQLRNRYWAGRARPAAIC